MRLKPTEVGSVSEIEHNNENKAYKNKAYIVTDISSTDSDIELQDNDVYFKNKLSADYKLFKSVDQYSRVYGIYLASADNILIDINNGKVSATKIEYLSSNSGYIGNNNGIDINPSITLAEGSIYGVNNGLVIYAQWTIASSNVISSASTGDIRLAVIKDNTTGEINLNFNGAKLYDSYIEDESAANYTYYSHSGVRKTLSKSLSKFLISFAYNGAPSSTSASQPLSVLTRAISEA